MGIVVIKFILIPFLDILGNIFIKFLILILILILMYFYYDSFSFITLKF